MRLRRRYHFYGRIQGVGFRPFIFHLAQTHELSGWICNEGGFVSLEVEGPVQQLADFYLQIKNQLPSAALISRELSWDIPLTDTAQYPATFRILPSQSSLDHQHDQIVPDLAMCAACRDEVADPSDRRYLYAFNNCTQCGPRFSVVRELPYDRAQTTMADFRLCPRCQAEYEDPLSRRFHAQPIACPKCGPTLWSLDPHGDRETEVDKVIALVRRALLQNKIVAVKGLGGFHLLADATSHAAVQTLRLRKQRPRKPFAVMFRDLQQARSYIEIEEGAADLLTSSSAPIVLCPKLKIETIPTQVNPQHLPTATNSDMTSQDRGLADNLAPGLNEIGALLPYTPLHYLLLSDYPSPVVCTSGNLSEEPICKDNDEMLTELKEIADLFILHNRPIARAVDDSVVSFVEKRPMVMRRARGYAPGVYSLSERMAAFPLLKRLAPALAVGGDLKGSFALSNGDQIYTSQHLGDLMTSKSQQAFRDTIFDFQRFYRISPAQVYCDLHPHYYSSMWARRLSLPVVRVQHHLAHALGVIFEHQLRGPVLAFTWDGTGFGCDESIWGGEALWLDGLGNWQRVGHLLPFPLIGGEGAIREPRRLVHALNVACGLPTDPVGHLWTNILDRPHLSPLSSSMGRLFDAVATLLCPNRGAPSHEGELAMELESLAQKSHHQGTVPLNLVATAKGLTWDWRELWRELNVSIAGGLDQADLARIFHNSLTAAAVALAEHLQISQIVLTGGVFQNKLLLQTTVKALKNKGFQVFWGQHCPVNDGGIALGQVVAPLYVENPHRQSE